MKQLKIPYLAELDKANIEQSDKLLSTLESKQKIETLNWPESFPYLTDTYFQIARSKEAVFVRFSVVGEDIKAVYTQDQSPVHEDSCVEFFCMPEGSDHYTNFEFNAIGTCSASKRKGKNEDVNPFSKEEMLTIERYASLGTKTIELTKKDVEWQLTVKIPMKLMQIDSNNLPEKIRANFYKCGDLTHNVHFISWLPIKTDEPNFHQPQFFGELYF